MVELIIPNGFEQTHLQWKKYESYQGLFLWCY